MHQVHPYDRNEDKKKPHNAQGSRGLHCVTDKQLDDVHPRLRCICELRYDYRRMIRECNDHQLYQR